MKKVLLAIIVCLTNISLLSAPASAATKTTITWKATSLRAGATAKLSALATSNSPGKKKWARKGNCTLSAKTIKMGSGPCTLTLSIAKSGKYPAKSSTKTIRSASTNALLTVPKSPATTNMSPSNGSPVSTPVTTMPVTSMPPITTSTTAVPTSSAPTPSSTTTTSTTTTTTTVPIVLRTIGTSYRGDDNLTVTLNSFVKTETDGSYRYTFNYTLKNENVDTEIGEGTWKIFKAGGGGTPQYGSFNNLFYNGTRTRSYTFEVLKNVSYLYIAYHSDVFFQDTPPGNALVFALP